MLRLLKISPAEVFLILSAYRWLLWGRNELHGLRGKGWLVGDKERESAEKARQDRPTTDEIREMVKAIDRAARTPFQWSKCLQKSLALHKWLATKGVLTELHIGVKKDIGGIKAHAWLEYQDEVINDRPDETAKYVPLTRGLREKNSTELASLVWK